MSLTFEISRRSYSIEIGVPRMFDLLDSEDIVTDHAALKPGVLSLSEKLEKLPGVSGVEYDGHFGPAIFLTVEDEHDDDAFKASVAETIESHLTWCAGLKKDARFMHGRVA